MNLIKFQLHLKIVDFLHICGDEPYSRPYIWTRFPIFSIYVEMNLNDALDWADANLFSPYMWR